MWVIQQSTPGGSWGIWTSLGGSLAPNARVCLVNTAGGTDIFARFSDATLRWRRRTSLSGGWTDWVSLGGAIATDPGGALTPDGRVEVFALTADDVMFHRAQTSTGTF